ncbi:hypothetical protein GCM10009850_050120 [Nonomuraea monospora]|uniref:Uncharacterized protein n=1 Tax=Nonomuraea monospora TaxID=568818 RepID=A0ABP5PD62_9ACTN
MTLTFTGVAPAAADVPAGAGVCPPPHAASINTDAAAARAARVLITELLQGAVRGMEIGHYVGGRLSTR